MQSLVSLLATAVFGAVALIALQELWQRYKARPGSERTWFIVGDWVGSWWLGDDESQPLYVREHDISITSADNAQIRGTAKDSKGTYLLEGNASEHGIVSMFYAYRDLPLNGVVILKPSPTADEYAGHWLGYLQEGTIGGGKVIWQKLKVMRRSLVLCT